jgi:ubiquinone/menaquinone biosynthesis C-methylase UbiE
MSRVLEAGCGIGAQTTILARNNPDTHFVSIDISEHSITEANALVHVEKITNVTFLRSDIFNLPFEEEIFDHVFICFVLEHLQNPMEALKSLGNVLRKGGSITVIEGDHGSFYCYPETKEAMHAVKSLIDVQAGLGGNSLIGRQLFPLLNQAEFKDIHVSPRMVYVDASNPDLIDGFSKKTFIAMVEGVRDQALSLRLIDEKTWKKGIMDLYRATEKDGTFCYTFFKGTAIKQ